MLSNEYDLKIFSDPVHMMEAHCVNYILGGAAYLCGVSLYLSQVPERCKPGAFDICGHSH